MKLQLAALVLALAATGTADAHGGTSSVPVPPELRVMALPSEGVVDLRFSDMFRLPVGAMGLESSAKLLSLAGKPVRLVGYMASVELPMAGRLVLAPLPVALGDEDESLADDLPVTAVFVHLSATCAERVVPNLRGLVQFIGTLQLGAQDEPDGHVSSVRLLLDEAASLRLVNAVARTTASPSCHP